MKTIDFQIKEVKAIAIFNDKRLNNLIKGAYNKNILKKYALDQTVQTIDAQDNILLMRGAKKIKATNTVRNLILIFLGQTTKSYLRQKNT